MVDTDLVRSHADYPTLSEIHLDMLIFMARFGRILKRHAAKLWFRGQQVTAWRHLDRLHELGLVVKAPFYRPARGRPPVPVGDLYILTDAGEEMVRECFPKQDRERFTTARRGSIKHQAEHQIELIDFVVQLLGILPSIPGVVGINGAIEMRLGPDREPRCDGLIWVRRQKVASEDDPIEWPLIPWLGDREREGQTSRWYAVEIDRNTEAANIIAAKAQAYRQIYTSGWNIGKYQRPVPLFIVPTESRREVVLREWERGWPGSDIFITTKPQLDAYDIDAPIWIAQRGGQRIVRGFVEGWWDWTIEE